MTAMPSYWLQPVNKHNAKIVVRSGKPKVVMTEPTHESWDQFWQGVLTGSIPSVIAGFAWFRGFVKERISQKDTLDQGFREYLMNENMKLNQQRQDDRDKTEAENKRLNKELEELRHNFGLLQIEVGKTQQRVDKQEQDRQ